MTVSNQYLASSQYIDWMRPAVLAKAAELAAGVNDKQLIAERCFTFVRDEIKHSFDYNLNPVICNASDVLKHATGYCYAKSHLLAALLRANQIPAGLCYQRLMITDQPPYCLHGLNAIYLTGGWYRVEARGNKQGVNAEFCPPLKKLAFAADAQGDADFARIWAEPLEVVAKLLTSQPTWEQVEQNLADVLHAS